MKKLSIVFALLFAFTVSAQDNNKQDKLDELFDLMSMDSMINTMYDQMETMFSGVLDDSNMSSEEMAIHNKYRKQLTKIMKTEMSWQAMKVDLKQIYLQNFTESEIADMVTFYKSPTGQSVLRTMPVVMQESMQIGQAMAVNAMPKLTEITERKNKELHELRSKNK